jgi:RHS repeat-associated protein
MVTDEMFATVLEDNDYYPYGGVAYQSVADDLNNHFFFTGKERDAETGLDYFGARYYGSGMGRWMSPDEGAPDLRTPQSLNRYEYVRNNPLARVDPDGNVDIPAQSARINQVLAQDPTLLSIIKSSPNYSQRAFENGLTRGALANFSTGNGAILRGLAGEANVLDQMWKGGFAAISQPPLLGAKPDLAMSLFSFSISIPLLGQINHGYTLPNVVTTAGSIGSATLSTSIKAAFYEVKSGLSTSGIADGVAQVIGMANALKADNIPGVAILLVDADAWANLSANRQAAYVDSVSDVGGYIQVQQGLADAATARAQEMVNNANQ